MSTAGGSAGSRYEHGRAKHRAGRRRPLAVNLMVATPLAVVVFVWAGAVGYTFGPWLAVGILLVAFTKAWVEPTHVRAWGIGATGESITEAELSELPDEYRALHDRRMPGSRANIDHLVNGPGGVFVVESKRMAGKLTIRDDEVFIRGRNTSMVDQVLHQAETVASVLSAAGLPRIPVRPILRVQEADAPLFRRRPLGVPIVLSGRQLRRAITSVDSVLSPVQVQAVLAALEVGLRPMVQNAVHPPPVAANPPASTARPTAPQGEASKPVLAACPRCGKEMVLRRNRQHQAFLGCSQFPLCRGTRPWRE
jgi:hypothetical protein